MFSVADYSVAYDQSEVINQLNMAVASNEIVAIIGRNGMGKTTLMKSLIGMIPSRSGQITLDNMELSAMQSHARVKNGMAFVPQGRMIFSTMTVQENIETGLTTAENKKIPARLYDLFPALGEMKSRRGGNLSGGQQQQLAIARALASQPRILLLDEPTEGIQPSIIRDMARTLRRIRDEHKLSIIVTEQVLSFALDIADRILVMEKGAIIHEEPRATVDQEKIAAFLSV